MDDVWWARVREAQLKQTDHWEMQYSDTHPGRPFWINWVTGEKQWNKPEISNPPRASARALECDEDGQETTAQKK
jgi:hypothetical protein